jgi:hypothetical protein
MNANRKDERENSLHASRATTARASACWADTAAATTTGDHLTISKQRAAEPVTAQTEMTKH